MIRALLKALILLLIPALAPGDPLDDSVHLLAGQAVAAPRRESDRARHGAQYLVPSGRELSRAQALLAWGAAPSWRSHRRSRSYSVRKPQRISACSRGSKADASAVEMVAFRFDPPPASVLRPILRRLLWTQSEPVLDLSVVGDTMLLLEPSAIASYERRGGNWTKLESVPIDAPPTAIRAAAWRLKDLDLRFFFPGMTCCGTTQPVKLNCEAVNLIFTLNGAPVHFTPGRNNYRRRP